jgi:hypothetical protein
MQVVHCVIIGNDGLVCVLTGKPTGFKSSIKMGNFKNNIWIKRGNSLPDNWGGGGNAAVDSVFLEVFVLGASRRGQATHML